jgi:3-oxoacyl-[acyl-carrier protein] reductase
MSAGFYAGRTIVITGGAGGIGLATANILLLLGAEVVLVDVDETLLSKARHELGAPEKLRTVVSRLESPEACSAALEASGGHLHALVHLAGTYVPDLETSPEDSRGIYDQVIAANLTNAYDIANAFAVRVTGAGPGDPPRLVFASSVAFRRGSFDHAAYSAAKGGIVGLVRAMARRHAPRILVNALAPGVIDTAMPRHILEARRDEIIAGIPLGRLGRAEEVAGVIEFLCGPSATYITAQVINVDGGIIPS